MITFPQLFIAVLGGIAIGGLAISRKETRR